MANDDTTARERAQRAVKELPRWVIVLTLIVALVTGAGVAQTVTGDITDDFEDGTATGWDGYGPYPEVVDSPNQQESVGNKSLYALSQQVSDPGVAAEEVNWEEGPTLNTTEGFDVKITMRPAYPDNVGPIRVGINSPNPGQEGENVYIMLTPDDGGVTYLATYDEAQTPTSSSERIDNSFANTWINVRLHSDGEGSVQLKVWEVGTQEPTDYQLQENFTGATGKFGTALGSSSGSSDREIWIDSVTIAGEIELLESDPSLSLETRQLFRAGETHDYSVIQTRNESGNNVTYTVTENATVTSYNDSALSVDEANNTLTAAENATAQEVTVRATYNGSTTYTNVTVAEPTVENLQIVPGIWRVVAVGQDDTLFALLVATFLSIPAARYTSAFGGLAVGQLVMTIGWLAGYVGFGIAAVSLFVSLFIGLNLAANTDYVAGGVRR